MSKFYKIFLSVLAGFAALLLAGSVFLVVVLADYEATRPASLANKFFEQQVKTGTFEDIGGTRFETKADIITAFNEKCKGKDLSLLSSAASDENTFKYVVKSGEERVLSFAVVPSGEKKGFFQEQIISDVKFLFGENITLRAPADCTVYVNGVALDENYRAEEETAQMDLPEGISAIPVYTYRVEGICGAPAVTAKDSLGSDRTAEFNAETGDYEIGHGYSEALKTQYGALSLDAARTYATRMQNDCGFGEVARYFQSGTKTYESIRTSEVYWVWAHEGFDFSDEWCGEFKALSENVFTCRVKMTQTLYLTNNQPYKDYIDVTLCFNKQLDGNYLVYSLKANK